MIKGLRIAGQTFVLLNDHEMSIIDDLNRRKKFEEFCKNDPIIYEEDYLQALEDADKKHREENKIS